MNIRHELLLIYKLVLRVLVEEASAQDMLVQLDQDHSMLNLSIYSKGMRIDHRSGRSVRLMEEARSRAAAIRGALDLHTDEKGTTVLFICPSTF
jgi:glucose-6-phosphate-specific signal transduction histidine kinase